MVIVHGLVIEGLGIGEVRGPLLGEEQRQVLLEGRLVALDRQQVVGALVSYGARDLLLAAHGVDGHQSALELQHLEQPGDGDDLVLLVGDGLLAQHQLLAAGPRRDHVQGGAALARIPGAPRGLAVDGDHIVLADTLVYGAEALRPGDEAVAEGVVVERVEQVVDGVVAGYAFS